jgi:hypothetical protein
MRNPFLDTKKLTLKNLQKITVLILTFTLFQFFFFIYTCVQTYFYHDSTAIIKVYNFSDNKTYKSFDIGEHSFVNGSEGKLYYKASSLGELLLFETISDLNIINSLIYLIIGFILFFTIKNITEEKSFTNKLINVMSVIIIILLFAPMINREFQMFVVEYILDKNTNNNFTLIPNDARTSGHTITFLILLMFLYFLKKGNDLQEEQSLTV